MTEKKSEKKIDLFVLKDWTALAFFVALMMVGFLAGRFASWAIDDCCERALTECEKPMAEIDGE